MKVNLDETCSLPSACDENSKGALTVMPSPNSITEPIVSSSKEIESIQSDKVYSPRNGIARVPVLLFNREQVDGSSNSGEKYENPTGSDRIITAENGIVSLSENKEKEFSSLPEALNKGLKHGRDRLATDYAKDTSHNSLPIMAEDAVSDWTKDKSGKNISKVAVSQTEEKNFDKSGNEDSSASEKRMDECFALLGAESVDSESKQNYHLPAEPTEIIEKSKPGVVEWPPEQKSTVEPRSCVSCEKKFSYTSDDDDLNDLEESGHHNTGRNSEMDDFETGSFDYEETREPREVLFSGIFFFLP